MSFWTPAPARHSGDRVRPRTSGGPRANMTVYDFSLVVGAIGLVAMGLGGMRHGHGATHTGSRHPGTGPGHGLHRHTAAAGHKGGAHAIGGGIRAGIARAFWTLTSPRVLFSLLVGFGAAGALAAPHLAAPAVLGVAIGGALVFELGVVGPLWRTLLRFGSQPALTLDTALFDEARAVSGFDARGDGLIALEIDGQVVQLLGTLTPADRAAGRRVRAGDRVRVEAVDDRRNRCMVSYIGA
jgi:hypothetical protein